MAETTANRPSPAASGTLAKTPFVHLLVYALGRRLSGTIEFSAPDGTGAAVLFVDGQPARARTLDGASRGMRGGPGEGEELGRRLHEVAALPGATEYAYYPGYDAFGGPGAKGVDPIPLLWDVLSENPPWEHVNGGLARLGASRVRLAAGADVNILALPSPEARALEHLQALALAPSGLATAAGLEEATAKLLVYLLLLTKKADIVAVSEPPAPAPVPSRPPEARQRPPSGGSFAAAVPPPKTLAPELAQRWVEVMDRAVTIDRANYFAMLDVEREATREEIDAVYFALAKRWHPDRLPAELAPVKESCARVFARMSEAHATLVDDEKRKRYMRLLADGSGSPETQESVAKVVEAATNFQKAEVLFKRSDAAQAEAFCRKAIEADPTQADYHAFLAWLIAVKPESQSPEKTAECIAMLDQAIGLSYRCERAFFWRAMLYKRVGQIDAAVADFRRAAELNPRNIDAAREVRLYQMRAGQRASSASSPPPPPSGRPAAKSEEGERPSLLGRLFKR